MNNQIGIRLSDEEFSYLKKIQIATKLDNSTLVRIALRKIFNEFAETGAISVLANQNQKQLSQ